MYRKVHVFMSYTVHCPSKALIMSVHIPVHEFEQLLVILNFKSIIICSNFNTVKFGVYMYVYRH